jgi:hypothetical protein
MHRKHSFVKRKYWRIVKVYRLFFEGIYLFFLHFFFNCSSSVVTSDELQDVVLEYESDSSDDEAI